MIRSRSRRRRAFTITEILVVIGVILVIAGLLLAALVALKDTGQMAETMSRMRQIGLWMTSYSTDNRDTVLPSQFDYSSASNPGLVRSVNPTEGDLHRGTWTDILWTQLKLGPIKDVEPTLGTDYRFDSPDKAVYEQMFDYDENPFRAIASNSRDVAGGTGALPYGTGAVESGLAGFFAANNFFDSRPSIGAWYSTGQIRSPERSMYLVDSYAGEIIEDEEDPYDSADTDGDGQPDVQVDFRYTDHCVMLFLDAHADPQAAWENIEDLEGDPDDPEDSGRGVRIRNLTSR